MAIVACNTCRLDKDRRDDDDGRRGGALLVAALRAAADAATGVDSYPLRAVADAMEVIPRILATNCGAKVVRVLTELRAKQQTEGPTWGIDLC